MSLDTIKPKSSASQDSTPRFFRPVLFISVTVALLCIIFIGIIILAIWYKRKTSNPPLGPVVLVARNTTINTAMQPNSTYQDVDTLKNLKDQEHPAINKDAVSANRNIPAKSEPNLIPSHIDEADILPSDSDLHLYEDVDRQQNEPRP
ncbi:RAM signaling network component [Branchiostoma belcheri]|nr:RAM signaling network component [Branchiostoma belcheri]